MKPGLYAHVVTSEGDFTFELLAEQAPRTVENFVGLAEGTKEWTDPRTGLTQKRPFYDGIIFHRVIDGFMIQAGDPLATGKGGPGYMFADEFHPSLRHDRAGVVSMANKGPNTNESQFFVTLAAVPRLDDKHSVFGTVVSGMEMVRRIGRTPTGEGDRPLTDVVIRTVRIERVAAPAHASPGAPEVQAR